MNNGRTLLTQFLFLLAVLPVLLNAAPVIDGKFDPNEGYDLGQVMVSALQGSSQTVVGTLYKHVDSTNGDVSIAYVQSKDVNDNSYGANAVNWGGTAHTLDKLLKSDKAMFRFTDGNGTAVSEFTLDYFSGPPDEPSYDGLGVTGGDGSVNVGSASWVLASESSLDYNFNVLGHVLTTDSPEADANYNLINTGLNFPGWIFDMVYEIKVSSAAFGSAGLGDVVVLEVHNSPPKIGDKLLIPEPGPSKITGAVFCDDNGNGAFDANETGFGGTSVAITLTGTETVTLKLVPSQDTYIREDDQNKNFGADNKLRTKSQTNKESRTLVQFDLSGIPSGATITSADLNLYLKSTKGPQQITVEGHRVTASWTETGATWNNRDGTNGWTSSGGDFDSTVVGSFTAVKNEKKVWKTLDVKTLVDQWLAGTANDGILLKQSPSDSQDNKKEYTSSDETKKIAEQPFLEIIYQRTLSGSSALTDNTDTQGSYSFDNLNQGSYTLTAAAGPTYTNGNVKNVTLQGGRTETVNFGIECNGGAGGGLVVELETFTAVGTDGQVTLNWLTASEVDSAGFDILRSNSIYGQYERVNYELIPARGRSFAGADYSYGDANVSNGETYYYKLEEIETDGDTHVHGPVSATPGVISILSPADSGSLLLSEPKFEILASPDVKRIVLYISPSKTLSGKGSIRLKVKRDGSIKLSRRARKRLARLASNNGGTLYAGAYGAIKGKRGLKLLSHVNSFTALGH